MNSWPRDSKKIIRLIRSLEPADLTQILKSRPLSWQIELLLDVAGDRVDFIDMLNSTLDPYLRNKILKIIENQI